MRGWGNDEARAAIGIRHGRFAVGQSADEFFNPAHFFGIEKSQMPASAFVAVEYFRIDS